MPCWKQVVIQGWCLRDCGVCGSCSNFQVEGLPNFGIEHYTLFPWVPPLFTSSDPWQAELLKETTSLSVFHPRTAAVKNTERRPDLPAAQTRCTKPPSQTVWLFGINLPCRQVSLMSVKGIQFEIAVYQMVLMQTRQEKRGCPMAH